VRSSSTNEIIRIGPVQRAQTSTSIAKHPLEQLPPLKLRARFVSSGSSSCASYTLVGGKERRDSMVANLDAFIGGGGGGDDAAPSGNVDGGMSNTVDAGSCTDLVATIRDFHVTHPDF